MGLFWLSGGAFLGWALGANDAANVFGAAVSTRAVRFRLAAVLMALFICAGALLEGQGGIDTLGSLARWEVRSAFIVSAAAALTVTVLTMLRLPISTSQAVVGAIIGVGLTKGEFNAAGLGKVVACWFGTPVGAFLFAVAGHYLFSCLMRRFVRNVVAFDRLTTIGLVLTGIYGSYALGANNVANTTGVFVGLTLGPVVVTAQLAALVGSLAIVAGAVTFSRRVMETVGNDLVRLDHFTAFVATLSSAVTVHAYAVVGVPVSSSQAIVGAVLGIGVVRGVRTVNLRMLRNIVAGWFATPALAAAAAFALNALSGAR